MATKRTKRVAKTKKVRTPGEGEVQATADTPRRSDSAPKKISQSNSYQVKGHRVRVSVEANSEDALKEFGELIEAGFRTRKHLSTWGMETTEWWQLHMFPSLEEDMKCGVDKLIAQKLGDEADSWAGSLAWEITRTFEHLWKALHRVALEAKNENHQRDAQSTLGRVYAEARHNEQDSHRHPITTTKEFRRKAYPFKDSRRPPDPKLVKWVSSRMNIQRSIWERALDVLIEEKVKGVWRKTTTGEDGTRTSEWTRVNTVANAWAKFDRDSLRGMHGTLSDWLRDHPFRTTGLSFDELSDFPTVWDRCLLPVLRVEWDEDVRAGRLEGMGETRFTAKFGDSKRPMTGYRLAKQDWDDWWKGRPKRMLENYLEVRQRIKAKFSKLDEDGEK